MRCGPWMGQQDRRGKWGLLVRAYRGAAREHGRDEAISERILVCLST